MTALEKYWGDDKLMAKISKARCNQVSSKRNPP